MKNSIAKKLLKVVFGILSLLLVLGLLLLASVFWLIEHPKESYAYAEKHFFPADLKITWEDLQFSGKNLGSVNFEIDWQMRGLSIQKVQPRIDLPISFFHLKAGIFPKSSPAIVIHDLSMNLDQTLHIRLATSAKSQEIQNPFQTVQSYFNYINIFQKWLRIESLSLELKKLEWIRDDGDAIGLSAKLVQLASASGKLPLKMQIQTEIPIKEASTLKLTIDGDLMLDQFQTEQKFLDAKIHVLGFGIESTQQIRMAHADQSTWIQSTGPFHYHQAKLNLLVTPQLKITLDPNQASLSLEGQVAGLPGPVAKIDGLKAQINTPFEAKRLWSEKASSFSISAPVSLFFVDASTRKPLEENCKCKIPEVLLVEAKGRVWLSHLFGEIADTKATSEKRPVLDAEIHVESIENKMILTQISGSLLIEEQNKQFFYKPNLDGSIEVRSYQGFRRFLDAKNILIPAPFDVLEGNVLLSTKGSVETSDAGYLFPLNLKVELASNRQKVSLQTDAKVLLSSDFKQAHVDIQARINDLQVILPPLDPMKGKPRISMDQRILKAPRLEKKQSSTLKDKFKQDKFKLFLSLEVETVKPAAIRLLSKYFEPYLPLTLQIKRDSAEHNSGFIQTEKFQIVYLRRKVQVEKMKLDLSQADRGIFPVSARFKIQQTQYLISIDITGTTDQPQIVMSSEPYLPESEIISVLLYDRLGSELISADAEAAGGVQAAMADRAIGLFGLWAFAATPIKSFSYNPVTKVYSATVALADDVTAGIGTNWEASTRLELRKRVSRKWMLTAAWTQGTGETAQSTKLVLQWEQRF